MRLQPYPQYKPSGSLWLGEVPVHWQVRKLRTLVTPRSERNQPELPLLSVARERGVFVRSLTGGDDNHNVIPEDLSNYKVARKGDLVINKMKAWQGSMGIAPCDGIVSPAYFVFNFQMAYQPFGQMLIRSKPYVAHFSQASDGVRVGQWDLSIRGMREIPILIPSDTEQKDIARFLEIINRRIDRVVLAKKKLITLLNEQKQTIIHHAVTRGLDPNVRLKPSGVDWLGEVPEHWEVWRIGHFAKVGNGSTPSRSNSSYWTTDGFPWLNSSNVHKGRITDSDQFVTGLALTECHLPIVQPDSILIAITGQGKTRGTAALLSFEATINQHIAYVSPQKTFISSEFLQLALSGAYQDLRRISENSGSTRGALTCEDIKHFKVGMPPLEEQKQIVSMVSSETQALESMIIEAQEATTLIQEYRTRLISDVVTGKIDVRKVSPLSIEEVGVEEFEMLESIKEIEAESLHESEELAYADD